MESKRWLAAGVVTLSALTTAADPTEDPRDVGLVERSAARLAQIDITVTGPADVIGSLLPSDFEIKVNRTKIRDFRLDALCETASAAGTVSETGEAGEPSPAASAPSTYLFYFDQPHLSLAGRAISMDLARELVDELVRDGNQAMIVSNARRLEVIEPFSDDPERLQAALDRLERDPGQMDAFTEQEDTRLRRVIETLNEQNNTARAVAAARVYQKEELFQTDKDLRRLELALGQLVESDPPKALLYFADQMRSNPGAHYLSFFGESLKRSNATLSFMKSDVLNGVNAMDRVVNEATAQGIRVYPVQPQGLSAPSARQRPNMAGMSNGLTVTANSRVRENDTRDTLRNLAGETGGRAYLNGIGSRRIAQDIRDDASCIYLASFDPSEFRQDSALRIVVKPTRDDITLRSRGRLVVQSESTRRTARLLRAFGAPGSLPDPVELTASMVATGFADGVYTALLQIRVPGTPLQAATWDLGASLVRGDKIARETSGRMTVSAPGTPVVFESELRFKPGAYELVAVVHEEATGLVASRMIELDWPDPGQAIGPVGTISLIQPGSAAFLRGDERRERGSLALAEDDVVQSDLPLALVGLVCRSRRGKGELTVERRLIGGSMVDYPPMELSLTEQRCAQVRDLFPAETLSPGDYRYEMRVLRNGESGEVSTREFVVSTPAS